MVKIHSSGLIVDSDGTVTIPTCRYHREHKAKILYDKDGYEMVCFNYKQYRVHKLVAELFVPNPDNKPCIDHKNRNRTDNRADNLEWVTVLENNYNKTTTLPVGERKCDLDKAEYNRRIARNYYHRKKAKGMK